MRRLANSRLLDNIENANTADGESAHIDLQLAPAALEQERPAVRGPGGGRTLVADGESHNGFDCLRPSPGALRTANQGCGKSRFAQVGRGLAVLE